MKTIGMIGGMSWESTVTYYQIVNRVVQERLGGFHSAKVVLCSLDFDEVERCQSAGDWDRAAAILADAAARLELAGADIVLICTNTMHKVADEVRKRIRVPLLHIAEATAAALLDDGIGKVGLLGTIYTMEQDFYKRKLVDAGIEVLVPDKGDRELVNRIIFQELCLGQVLEESRRALVQVVDRLAARGAQGVILGCTEIGLLLRQEDTPAALYDTTLIHAQAAAFWALRD